MKQTLRLLFGLVIAVLIATPAHAALVSVSGPPSSANAAPAIIAPPIVILDDCVTNIGMQGFDEAQGVLTTVDHPIDGGGVIPAGTLVDSHMIFLNSTGSVRLDHFDADWTMDGAVIGVMSDGNGTREAASTFELGGAGTNYTTVPISPATTPCGTNNVTGEQAAPYGARGIEVNQGCTANNTNDGYVVSGSSITVCMVVTEPGDWIRVITEREHVDIDIKPGSDPNSINCTNEDGVIAVAILTTDVFDATTVDHTTVTFEGAVETHVNKKTGEPRRHEEDVDGDGDIDLVFHFRLGDTWLDCYSTEGTLLGTTYDGYAIGGVDTVRMIDNK